MRTRKTIIQVLKAIKAIYDKLDFNFGEGVALIHIANVSWAANGYLSQIELKQPRGFAIGAIASLAIDLAVFVFLTRHYRQQLKDEQEIGERCNNRGWNEALRAAKAADFWRIKAIRLSEQSGIPIETIWDGNEPKLPVNGKQR